jgi:hypothetical protein
MADLRRLAQAFPHEFKLAYGAEVMQLGQDVVEDIAKRHGAAGLIRLIADIVYREKAPGDRQLVPPAS